MSYGAGMVLITVLTGYRPYDDPWHPFAETTAAVAEILAPLGEIRVRADVDRALNELADRDHRPDLLVMNVSGPHDGAPPLPARDSLTGAVRDGMPLLGLHSTATTFAAWPEWSALLGGTWVRGVTFHPEASECDISMTDHGRAVSGVADGFTTSDERYTALHLEAYARPLAVHEHEGVRHPLAWSHQQDGARVVYLGLGHDADAYVSEGHRELLRGCADWLLRSEL